MGRPKIMDEFTEFFEWMRRTNRCSPGVAKAYASYMRRIHRELGGHYDDVEEVNRFFAKAHETEDGYAKLRSAYTMYVEYAAVTKSINLPTPHGSNIMRAKTESRNQSMLTQPLSSDVRRALRVLTAHGIAIQQIFDLTWGEIVLSEMTSKSTTHVQVPGKNATWLIPSSAMRTLWNYAQPGTNLYRPLVPREPGADEPYPFTHLRRESLIFTEEELAQNNLSSSEGSSQIPEAPRLRSEADKSEPANITTHEVLAMLASPAPSLVLKPFRPPSYSDNDDVEDEDIADEGEADCDGDGLTTDEPREVEQDEEDDDCTQEEVKKGGRPSLASLLGYDPNSDD